MTPFARCNLSRLLLELHGQEATGVVSLEDGKRRLSLYLKGGVVVYAEGDRAETRLVSRIASEKNLNRAEILHLASLSKNEPHRLGSALLDRRLISMAAWQRFLEEKVKAAFAEALAMQNPDIAFTQRELAILPVNFVHFPVRSLLLETGRKGEKSKQLRDYLVERDPCFRLGTAAPSLRAKMPLTPSEARLLSLLGTEKGYRMLRQETGVTLDELALDLRVLCSLGLIEEATASPETGSDRHHHEDIVFLYLHVLEAIKAELGEKRFSSTLGECTSSSTKAWKTLFAPFASFAGDRKALAAETIRRAEALPDLSSRRLLLLSSFNKLLYLMLARIKKSEGLNRTRTILERMMKALTEAEEGKRQPDLMLYLHGNLEDLAKRMTL